MGRLALFAFEGVCIFALGIVLVGLAQWVLRKLNGKKEE